MKLNIRNTYHQTLQLLKFQKKLVLPFFIFAAIEAIVVTLIYLSPRGIVRPVLAPVIKAFKGEMYLHYPANFLILPQLHSICRNFLSVILGSLLTGTAVVMINEAYQKRSALFMQSVKVAATKYLQLFTIILFIAIILNYSYKGLSFGIAHYFSGARRLLLGAPYSVWIGPITVILSVLILLVVQAFFAYALIILMLDKKGLFKSIWLSFVFCSKHLWQTLAIVTLPFYVMPL